MNLPSIEPLLPEDSAPLPPARRRRQRRAIVLPDGSNRAEFLFALSQRAVPSFDFFLFSLLCGIVIGFGLLLDSPALVFLGVLLAPFMAPMVGVALGTITGAIRYFFQSLTSLMVGCLVVFFCGLLAGWLADFSAGQTFQQAPYYTRFTWPGFLVLSLGTGLTTYLIVRAPHQKPLVTSVAIAYGLYLPAVSAGFGLGSGIPILWPEGLGVLAIHLIWSALLGTVLLGLLGLRPLNAVGYVLALFYAIVGVAAILIGQVFPPTGLTLGLAAPSITPVQMAVVTATPPGAVEATVTREVATNTPSPAPATPSPTRSLVPTRTHTLTITPMSTPVWARISVKEGNGALIREEPDYNATVVQSLLNGNLVEVLPEVLSSGGGVTWVRVRTVNGKEGWIVRALLATATPAANW